MPVLILCIAMRLADDRCGITALEYAILAAVMTGAAMAMGHGVAAIVTESTARVSAIGL